MSEVKYCIGVDVGGTNIAIGLVSLDERRICHSMSVKTHSPRPCEAITKDIVDVCKRLCEAADISISDLKWIGIASPGIVNDNTVVSSINLKWRGVEFARIVREATGVPCFIANDANAAAYAEAMWGAGEGVGSLVMLTLGTGVGGGVVMDGKIWTGINGFAAELGHTVLVPGGRDCVCGKKGCVEAYCSIPALLKDTKAMMQLYPYSVMWFLCNNKIDKVSGKTPFRAKEMGDEAATRVIEALVENLALAISNVINILQPDVVCVGGGLSREGEVLMAPVRKRVEELTFGTSPARTRVVAAAFRNDAGIIGAALLGLQSS